MNPKKRLVRFLTLVSSLFFATSCSFNFNFSIKSESSPIASKEETSSLPIKLESSIEDSSEEPKGPKDLLKRQLSSNYHDYGQHNLANFSYCPSLGSPKLLVIPVWFTDTSSYAIEESHKEDVRSDIEAAFFGTKEETGWNSVKSYYETLSDGRLEFNGLVTEWWESGMSSQTAGASQNATLTLLNNAVDWYFSLPDAEPRTSFDLDGDGYLDAVTLIYGAPDHQSLYYDWDSSNNSGYDNLWAYCSWSQGRSNIENPTANAFLWASYDFMYDRSKGYERTGVRYYGGGDTSHVEIDAHTFIHETGHLLGFNDYYDYSQQYNPAGGFSMQDENVGSHDPYSAMAAGWVDPILPNESMILTINPFQDEGHDLILLTNAWNGDNSPFDEYILLELYTPTGLNELDATYSYRNQYPQGPSEPGIRVWHVDSRLVKGRVLLNGSSVTFSSTPLTDPTIDGCYLMQTNTSYSSRNPSAFASYGSVLGQSYADYNLLQLIKNDTSATYKTRYGTNVSNNDLFGDGSLFNMSRYNKQFVHGNELNCNDYLGWQFDVTINETDDGVTATINLTKAN